MWNFGRKLEKFCRKIFQICSKLLYFVLYSDNTNGPGCTCINVDALRVDSEACVSVEMWKVHKILSIVSVGVRNAVAYVLKIILFRINSKHKGSLVYAPEAPMFDEEMFESIWLNASESPSPKRAKTSSHSQASEKETRWTRMNNISIEDLHW